MTQTENLLYLRYIIAELTSTPILVVSQPTNGIF